MSKLSKDDIIDYLRTALANETQNLYKARTRVRELEERIQTLENQVSDNGWERDYIRAMSI